MKSESKKIVGFYHYGVILTYLSVIAAIVGMCFSVGGNKPAHPGIGGDLSVDFRVLRRV